MNLESTFHRSSGLLFISCGVLAITGSLLLITRNTLLRWHHQIEKQNREKREKIILALDVAGYIFFWYAISIGMTLYNKWFLKHWEGGCDFSVIMSSIHMWIKLALSRAVVCYQGLKIQDLTTFQYIFLAIPIGLFTAADITLSNLSLLYITVSFYTIVKSGGNIWNLGFSILLQHQKLSFSLVFVVFLISGGIALSSYGTINFVFIGFLFVFLASIIGTLRWVLTQSMLSNLSQVKHRTLTVIYHISPASAIAILPAILLLEYKKFVSSKFYLDSNLFIETLLLMSVGGFFAFGLIIVEIALVKKTSALTLGIAGNLKDLLQIILAVIVFGEQLTFINTIGLVLAFSGMLLYTYIKQKAKSPTLNRLGSSLYENVEQHDDLDDKDNESMLLLTKKSKIQEKLNSNTNDSQFDTTKDIPTMKY